MVLHDCFPNRLPCQCWSPVFWQHLSGAVSGPGVFSGDGRPGWSVFVDTDWTRVYEFSMLNGRMATQECPCGFSGDSARPCTCSPPSVQKYRNRISGPILDRIDLHIEVPAVKFEQLRSEGGSEKSASVRERVARAREIQLNRLAGEGIYSNSQLKPKHLKKFCRLDSRGQEILDQAVRQLGLSARAYHRILKVARTIADLDHCESIATHHLLEAVQYRSLDRRLF